VGKQVLAPSARVRVARVAERLRRLAAAAAPALAISARAVTRALFPQPAQTRALSEARARQPAAAEEPVRSTVALRAAAATRKEVARTQAPGVARAARERRAAVSPVVSVPRAVRQATRVRAAARTETEVGPKAIEYGAARQAREDSMEPARPFRSTQVQGPARVVAQTAMAAKQAVAALGLAQLARGGFSALLLQRRTPA
ncbi:MAG: hypothetical protein WC740_16960, partial [Verrucomicrobiia bacterium]